MDITIYKDRKSLQTCSNVCHLSIQVNLNGFFLLVYHLKLQKFIFFQHIAFDFPNAQSYYYHKNIEQALSYIEILKYQFCSIACLYHPVHQTNVPTPLFQPQKALQLITLTSSYHEDEELHFHPIPFYNLTHIFSIPSFIISTLLEKNKRIQFYSTTLTFLNLTRELSLHQSEKNIFLIDFSPSFYQVSVVSQSQLLFIQHFLYNTGADIIATVQTIMNHHRFEEKKTIIYTLGTIYPDTLFYAEFKNRFPALRILQYFSKEKFPPSLENINNHFLPHLMYGHKLA